MSSWMFYSTVLIIFILRPLHRLIHIQSISTYPNRGLLSSHTSTSPTTHPSIRYPHSQYLSIRRTLFFKISSAISFAEPNLSELVPTLTGESNFASWSTALKYALDTLNPANAKSANVVNTLASTTTSKPTTANALSNPIIRYNNLFNN
ncbi:hypothetical protein ACN38_g10149 [Penicillium nordicum]|uniref:Retrotransposon Copia-like N-terminal domain-containing protein n=1 Tax=Penicillium nordicum TaxID=229535 RepID=A0A0M9WBZ2_9EURO|nr:hypothetical protein ACN38_g10149 [Penicillium nordicum]